MNLYEQYVNKISAMLKAYDWRNVDLLVGDLVYCWAKKRRVFLCGNGGSAANANHLANDLIYGVSPGKGDGIHAVSLSSNTSVMTCISNDVSYDEIFAYQLSVMAEKNDLLIVFSGSGNSKNIVNAVRKAKKMGLKTYAVIGFTGGKVKDIVDVPIHFPINDMQISEDCQQIVGHMIMKRILNIK
ncbi:MAG TPA: phosphoheptose isomerase [Lentisphaeria bacterium]|nr:MAG: phosphoheptose isomerase [Lentisphaerae bacterium GWF2_50_93]HCE45344.1 phosphoheptose isomerase [Lentisphaeria bacterium]